MKLKHLRQTQQVIPKWETLHNDNSLNLFKMFIQWDLRLLIRVIIHALLSWLVFIGTSSWSNTTKQKAVYRNTTMTNKNMQECRCNNCVDVHAWYKVWLADSQVRPPIYKPSHIQQTLLLQAFLLPHFPQQQAAPPVMATIHIVHTLERDWAQSCQEIENSCNYYLKYAMKLTPREAVEYKEHINTLLDTHKTIHTTYKNRLKLTISQYQVRIADLKTQMDELPTSEYGLPVYIQLQQALQTEKTGKKVYVEKYRIFNEKHQFLNDTYGSILSIRV